MRKPRDFDADLKALDDKARLLKTRKLQQLGELVVATGADALPIETLAGALLTAGEQKDAKILQGWHARGAGFFRGRRQAPASAAAGGPTVASDAGGTLPLGESTRA